MLLVRVLQRQSFIVPDGVAINKAETANKIIFIGFNSNVYTNKFSTKLSTCAQQRKFYRYQKDP